MAHKDGPKKTVLVVEDEPLILLLAVAVVEEAGFDAHTASNADEALLALRICQNISIVFTDIDMPGPMNGLELAFVVRERWPPIDIVIASGKGRPTRAEMPAGSVFLAKPYRVANVAEALHRVTRGQPLRSGIVCH